MTTLVSTWPDPTVIAASALRAMNMPADDADADVVQQCAQAAIELVDNYLGNPELTTMPTAVLDATTVVTVEVYRRKDAVFGVLNTWTSADFGPVRISTDWLKGVESMLHPWMRDSFGVG